MLIPYLAVNVTVFEETLFSMGSLLKDEFVSNIFKTTKAVEKFEISKDLSDSIISHLENYPITERALSTNVEIKDEYNLYMILDTLREIYGLAAPWYSSKGDAHWENSCKKLIEEGFLLKIAMVKKEDQLQILYGGND